MDLMQLLGLMASGQMGGTVPREAPAFGSGPQGAPGGPMGIAPSSPTPQGPAPTPQEPEQDIPAVMGAREHRGMFGLHGTPRNILGVLGDAFLAQGGGQAVYRPRQQQEREGDAMQHLQDNPMQVVQELARVNPDAAREMFHNLKRDDAYAANTADLAETRQIARQDRTRAQIASLGGAANAQTWPAIRSRLQQMATAGGVELPTELLPEAFSDDVRDGLIRYGTAPGTQLTADNLSDYRTRRLGQIDTHETNTNTYHQGQLGLGHERVGVARENVGVARQRVGVAQSAVDVQRSSAAERARHNRWDEANPSRSRRTVPPAAGGVPTTNQQMVEGRRYQEAGTGRIYRVVHGQKVYQ